jgi:hypothetical protein
VIFLAVVWRCGHTLRRHIAPAVSDVGWWLTDWADQHTTNGGIRLTADQARTVADNIIRHAYREGR